MNPEDYSRDDLVAGSVATFWLALGVVVLSVAWVLSLKWRDRFETRQGKNLAFVVGFAMGTAVIWLVFQTAARFLVLATAWPIWLLSLLGGAAAEGIVGIYRLERQLVTPESRGRWLLGLRLAALAMLVAILAQPVWTLLVNREINREVAVLIDDSQSMQLSDQRLTATEMLDRAALFGAHAAGKRPPMLDYLRGLEAIRKDLLEERDALENMPDPVVALESRGGLLRDAIAAAGERVATVSGEMETLRKGHPDLPPGVRNQIDEIRARIEGKIREEIAKAAAQVQGKNAGELLKSLAVILTELEGINARLPAMAAEADSAYFEKLSESNRAEVLESASRPRIDIARQLLRENSPREIKEGSAGDLTLLSQLKQNYNLRLYQFAREPRELVNLEEAFPSVAAPDSDGGEADDQALTAASLTDLTSALEHVLDNSSSEALAGILLLSDGRHNGTVPPEDSLRQLAVQNSPLCAVAIGGRLGPVDAAVLSVAAPESIYLGDRVLVKAGVKLDGLRGQEVKARLKWQGEVVEEQKVAVPDVAYRTELRFVHLPAEKGVFDYQVELAAGEPELFPANNLWDFKVAVTDDRTNVLLIDGVPRWEFRYLRNLFFGRDKSVHLQYVLLRPDEIDGLKKLNGQPASATRKFGDAEAESLPRRREEWQLFDVFILGDIPPASLGPQEWGYIREAVTERGATLICVAGSRYMPHAYDNETLRDLLPVTYEHSVEERFEGPEDAYRLELTAAGRSHPVMAQSASRLLNEQIWGRMPDLHWRTVSGGVKEGAEVLAYARPLDGGTTVSAGGPEDGSPESIEAAIRHLAQQKELEEKNALVIAHRAGLGKTVMMNFDRTWRFRYGVGDTYHHRFWGQLLRWGAGQNLRSGTETVRLGTDRLTYTPADPVEIVSKVLDTERRPVTDADLFAAVYLEGERILRQKMSYRTGSSGLYETSLAPLSRPGEYTVRLEGDSVAGQAEEGKEAIETTLLVVATRNPIELAELTADRDFLLHAAQTTGGKAVEIAEASTLADLFGAPKEVLTERRNITLWDKWPLLVTFLGLLTTEWLIRRRSGLA